MAAPIARALVLVLSVTTLGPVLHDLHDAACEPPLLLHDASQHRFSGAATDSSQPGTSQHCVACHLQRASRSPAVLKSPAPAILGVDAILLQIDQTLVADPASAPLPARAPPAFA